VKFSNDGGFFWASRCPPPDFFFQGFGGPQCGLLFSLCFPCGLLAFWRVLRSHFWTLNPFLLARFLDKGPHYWFLFFSLLRPRLFQVPSPPHSEISLLGPASPCLFNPFNLTVVGPYPFFFSVGTSVGLSFTFTRLFSLIFSFQIVTSVFVTHTYARFFQISKFLPRGQ